MLELYLNTTTRVWYDRDGNPFADYNPQMAFQSRETIKIIACTETPDAGEIGVDPANWTRDTSWAAIEGLSAVVTVDNDYIHKLKGALSADVAAGSVTSVAATITGASYAKIPPGGVLRLYGASGAYESLAYTARSVDGDAVTFTTEGTLTGDYSAGSVMDCDQAPYCSAYLSGADSDLAQGEFVFDLTADSPRLREEMDYSDTARLTVRGLECLFYRVADGVSERIKAYLCETFAVTGTLGNIDYEATPPDALQNQITAWIDSRIAAGEDIEVTADGTTWHEYHVGQDVTGLVAFHARNRATGGAWSDSIPLIPGPAGTGLAIDKTGTLAERDNVPAPGPSEKQTCQYYATDTGLVYFGTYASGTGWTWSEGVNIKGEKGDSAISEPAVQFTRIDATYGRCIQLDDVTPDMVFAWPVWDVKHIRWRIVSKNPAVTGNIVIIPVLDGVEHTPEIIAVGGTPAPAEFDFVATGNLSFRRDYENASDTLRDGDPVGALILNVELHK